MRRWQNETGGVLVYVLMVAAVLMIMVPTIILTSSTSKSSIDLAEKQKIVTHLAVSGMQAVVKNRTDSQKINYVLTEAVNGLNIITPSGQQVLYKQIVAVHGDTSENPVSTNLNLNYDVIISATLGNQSKKIVRNVNLAIPGITSVAPSPVSQQPNTMQVVAVTVNTINIANNTSVLAELVTLAGASFSPAVSATGSVNNNQTVVSLVVPNSVSTGNYLLKVSANTVVNSTAAYSVSASAPAANQATIINNGVPQTLTAAQFGTLQTITTNGTLFVPSGFLASQTNPNAPITYTAKQGIFINNTTGVVTLGTNSDITMKACSGPIIVDGAGIGALQSNISLQAGTYISAKSALLGNSNGSVRLTANDYIDLTGSTLYSTNIILSAFNNVAKIITTGATFGFGGTTTPSKVANNGTAVTCP